MASSRQPGVAGFAPDSETSQTGTVNGHAPGHVGVKHKGHAAGVSRVPGMTPAAADRAIREALDKAIELLDKRRQDLKKWDKQTQDNFQGWFGTVSPDARKEIESRIETEIKKMRTFKVGDFVAEKKPTRTKGMTNHDYQEALKDYNSDFAFVEPDRRMGTHENLVHIGPQFAAGNATTRAGTFIHELSHFWSVQLTQDVESCKIYRAVNSDRPQTMADCRVYGYREASMLAKRDPKMALMNADNFEFFVERHDPKDL